VPLAPLGDAMMGYSPDEVRNINVRPDLPRAILSPL
jgi:hypothetical protein